MPVWSLGSTTLGFQPKLSIKYRAWIWRDTEWVGQAVWLGLICLHFHLKLRCGDSFSHWSILLMSRVWSKLARVGHLSIGQKEYWNETNHGHAKKDLFATKCMGLDFVCFQKRPYFHTTNRHSHLPGATALLGQPPLKGQRVLVKVKGQGDSTSAPPRSRAKAATWGPTRSTLESYVSLSRLFWYNFTKFGGSKVPQSSVDALLFLELYKELTEWHVLFVLFSEWAFLMETEECLYLIWKCLTYLVQWTREASKGEKKYEKDKL